MSTVIVPRGNRELARRAIQASVLAGFEQNVVRTTSKGYEIPEAAKEFYDRLANGEAAGAQARVVSENGITIDVPVLGDAPSDQPAGLDYPKGNASQKKWEEFAAEHFGYDPSEGLTRNELVERFGEKEASAAE